MVEIAHDDRYFFQMYGLKAQPPATLDKAFPTPKLWPIINHLEKRRRPMK